MKTRLSLSFLLAGLLCSLAGEAEERDLVRDPHFGTSA